jgi:hypothetical protein
MFWRGNRRQSGIEHDREVMKKSTETGYGKVP